MPMPFSNNHRVHPSKNAIEVIEMAKVPIDKGTTAQFDESKFDPKLYNEDLKPLRYQTWNTYNIFAVWMSDVHSVAGYLTAGSLFTLRLASWQVLLALLIGILIVQFCCIAIWWPNPVR